MDQLLTHIASRKPLTINRRQAFNWCMAITLLVIALQMAYSYVTTTFYFFSTHVYMLTYAGALVVSLIGFHFSKKTGSQRAGNIAAFINGLALLVFAACVFLDGHYRFLNPEPIVLTSVLTLSLVGLLVTLVIGFILGSSGIESINAKSAFTHIVASSLIYVATIVGSIITTFFGWAFIDAILNAIVAFVAAQWALNILGNANAALSQPGT